MMLLLPVASPKPDRPPMMMFAPPVVRLSAADEPTTTFPAPEVSARSA